MRDRTATICYAEHMAPAERAFGEPPLHPTILPPELEAFLKDQEYACVSEATEQGTALVIKMPTLDIVSVRGSVPVLLRQALYQHPAAPVIQLVVHIFDQPQSPLALETFINVDDPHQRATYAALTAQDKLPLLFYDEALSHQLTKVIPYHQRCETAAILAAADRMRSTLLPSHFDFELAKSAVIQTTKL